MMRRENPSLTLPLLEDYEIRKFSLCNQHFCLETVSTMRSSDNVFCHIYRYFLKLFDWKNKFYFTHQA
jgi:hypothetical protein